jgi:hypothetical protein
VAGGFTLVEIMMVTFISSFVFAGVLSAYIFLGRGLTRQGNAEVLESRTRLALYYFNQDVSSANAVTISNAAQLGLTVVNPGLNPAPPFTVSVVYTYDLSDTVTRNVYTTAVPPVLITSLPLLTGLTGSYFGFGYYNFGGTTPSPLPSGTTWIKQVSMAYKTVAGLAVSGAQSHYTVVSSQVVMKNKPLLQ